MTPAEFAAARHDLGLSQPQLADALDIHPMTVSKYERGALDVPRVAELAMRYLAFDKHIQDMLAEYGLPACPTKAKTDAR